MQKNIWSPSKKTWIEELKINEKLAFKIAISPKDFCASQQKKRLSNHRLRPFSGHNLFSDNNYQVVYAICLTICGSFIEPIIWMNLNYVWSGEFAWVK